MTKLKMPDPAEVSTVWVLSSFIGHETIRFHMPFPTGGASEPSLSLQPFSRYLAPTHVNK